MYQRAFRLVREIVLTPPAPGAAAGAADQTLVVSGRLEYQACDDKICYNPVSVPLSWSFAVDALDRERSRVR